MKMFNFQKPAVLVATSFLLCLFVETAAFGLNLPSKASTYSPTSLHAEPPSRTRGSRRRVLGGIKRAVVGAATLAVFRQGPKVAVADDSIPTTGRIVELTVANLDGIEGNTGTIKLQLRPEWAPRGVKRFEVCMKVVFVQHHYLPYQSHLSLPFFNCYTGLDRRQVL
jgi:hypothetical protein